MIYDLSVIVPARNEEWLSLTVDTVLTAARAKTEVLVVLDGAWANPPLEQRPHLTIIHHNVSIGQRAACNEAARVSKAKYVCKLDAHCMVGDGFDVKLIEHSQPDWVQVPLLYNLRVFHWRCLRCNNQTDQGPQPTRCNSCKKGRNFDRVVIWKPKDGTWWQCGQCWQVQQSSERKPTCGKCNVPLRSLGRRATDYMNFNSQLQFKYGGKPQWVSDQIGDINDTMSLLGACFFMERDYYWKIGFNDEKYGSWGAQGSETAMKTWLSGGRLVVNKGTWYSHLFRTQPGFSFPYANPGADRAYSRAREVWYGNSWSQQVHPLSWLVEKFAPIPGWHTPHKDAPNHQAILDQVMTAGEKFYAERGLMHQSKIVTATAKPSKGICYYTDSRLDESIAEAVRNQLQKAVNGHSIVSVSLKPLDFGNNIVLGLERSALSMFQQILAGLSELDTDCVFLCEHDFIYASEHFQFTPPNNDIFYYNEHTYKVDAETGQAVFYYTKQTSGLCADRQLLIDHYRRRIERVEKNGFTRAMGFEPGTHRPPRGIDNFKAERWMSKIPNVDIRHKLNLTESRWSTEKFRNPQSCLGWKLVDEIPYWGKTKGRFSEWLIDVREGRIDL